MRYGRWGDNPDYMTFKQKRTVPKPKKHGIKPDFSLFCKAKRLDITLNKGEQDHLKKLVQKFCKNNKKLLGFFAQVPGDQKSL